MRLKSALTCAALLMFGIARADSCTDLVQGVEWPPWVRPELRWERRWGRCPRTCECGECEVHYDVMGSEDEYSSYLMIYNCGKVEVLQDNHNVAITCQNVSNICDELPFIQRSSSGTIHRLYLEYCPVPETFSCLLAKLGAADAKKVKIFAPRGELRVNNMEGLKRTTDLILKNAADQSSVPYDALRALPSLEAFEISGAKLHFPADELSESNETGDSTAYPRLMFFDLKSNQIKEVPDGTFRRLKQVTRLYLDDNQIMTINNESFIGMESLMTLSLSKNPFKVLPPGVFAHTPLLNELDLEFTGLEEIPNGAITGLQMLETITIKCDTGAISFGSRALADHPSLQKLSIESCIIKLVSSDFLQGDTKLRKLIITGAGLEELPKQFFKGLVNLEELNLQGNNIRALDSDIFSPLKALKRLNLDGNRIEMLPPRLFEGLSHLMILSANRNHMKVIHEDAFTGVDSLQELSLMYNELTSDENDSPFFRLSSLHTLRLRGNRLRHFSRNWFLMLLFNLRLLDLSENRYTELTSIDMKNLDVMIGFYALEALKRPDLLNPKPSAVVLLDENPFRCDCEFITFIRRLKSSEALDNKPRFDPGNATCASPPSLEGYSIKNLTTEQLVCPLKDADCPSDCVCYMRPATKSLELDCSAEPTVYPAPSKFGLEEMRLTLHSPPATFAKLPYYVVFLNLSGIGLTEIPKVPETVKDLDLSNNSLSRPPMELLKNIRLRLSSNPLLCDCSHVEDVTLLQNNTHMILDSDKVTCVDGGSPWRIDVKRLCVMRGGEILGGALAALGIIVAVAAALAYKYSLEIRVFLFSRGWFLKLVQEEDLDQNMQYDAFVSFSQNDARFVADVLVPKLEGENNLQLCVHYRDWLIGDMIPAQIARSVEQSRRTIVILSKSFLESTWGLLEFRAAHLRSQRERRARVLVVVLEDMCTDDMDAELRAYISTNTYLRWGDPWFWKKLLYALPHRRS